MTMDRPVRRVVATAIVGLVALSIPGCGSDGDVDDADRTTTSATEDAGERTTTTGSDGSDGAADADAWVAGFAVNFTSGDREAGELVLAEDAAVCVSEAWVAAIGVDVLAASELTPDELDQGSSNLRTALALEESTARSMAQAFAGCDVDLAIELAASVTAGEAYTDEDRACAEGVLDQAAVEDLFVATWGGDGGDSEWEAIYGDLVEACGDL